MAGGIILLFILIIRGKQSTRYQNIPKIFSEHSLHLLSTPPPCSQKVTLSCAIPFSKHTTEQGLRHSNHVKGQITNDKDEEEGFSLRQHNGTFHSKFLLCPSANASIYNDLDLSCM